MVLLSSYVPLHVSPYTHLLLLPPPSSHHSPTTMKSHNNNNNIDNNHPHPHPKLKTQLLSCAFFRHCSQSALSPTATPPPPPPLKPDQCESSSSTTTTSSSSSSSQSFTQWRFSLPPPPPPPPQQHITTPPPSPPPPPPPPHPDLQELFHLSHLHLTSSSSDRLSALHLLERSLVPNPPQHQPPCPPPLMQAIISNLRNPTGAKTATKVLFALCLSELNRRVAVAEGAVGAVVETALELEGAPAERALAALELMCTVAEGQVEVRAHALSVPVMVTMMGKMGARGKEYAVGVLGVVYGGGGVHDQQAAPPEEVARAVELALQGECSVRGRRKGGQLLKTLYDYGQPTTELTQEERRKID